MSETWLLALSALAFTLGFCLGALIGSHFVTRQQDARDRRQAKQQECLNSERRALNELRAALAADDSD